MNHRDIKLMHDRLVTVECKEPYDSTIVDEAAEMLLYLADYMTKTIDGGRLELLTSPAQMESKL